MDIIEARAQVIFDNDPTLEVIDEAIATSKVVATRYTEYSDEPQRTHRIELMEILEQRGMAGTMSWRRFRTVATDEAFQDWFLHKYMEENS